MEDTASQAENISPGKGEAHGDVTPRVESSIRYIFIFILASVRCQEGKARRGCVGPQELNSTPPLAHGQGGVHPLRPRKGHSEDFLEGGHDAIVCKIHDGTDGGSSNITPLCQEKHLSPVST